MILGFTLCIVFIFDCKNKSNVLTSSNYGGEFTSAICSDNIIGTQFHPEKVMEMEFYYLKILLIYKNVKIKNNSLLTNP